MFEKTKEKAIGFFCAALSEVLFGMSFIFTRSVVTDNIPASFLLGWRFLLAFIVLNLLLCTKTIRVDFHGKSILKILPIAVFQPLMYFTCETIGVKMTTASETGTIIATIPVITLVLSIVMLHQKANARKVIGILITLGGVLTCTLFKGLSLSFSVLGYFALFLAAFAFSMYTILSDRARQFNSIEITYVMVGTGAVVFSVAAIISAILTAQ